MSLCRWSHSPFYIYEECGCGDNEIKVQFEGYFNSNKILNDPIRNVYLRARNSGYDLLSSVELLVWLYPWALCNENKISHDSYWKILKVTRFLSYVRTYVLGEYTNNFRWITNDINDILRGIEKKIVNDPIHNLPLEEKIKILKEWKTSNYGR